MSIALGNILVFRRDYIRDETGFEWSRFHDNHVDPQRSQLEDRGFKAPFLVPRSGELLDRGSGGCRGRRYAAREVSSALVLVGLGETDAAFEALELGFQDRDSRLLYLGIDPRWEPLRGDPRYVKLMDRIGLPRG